MNRSTLIYMFVLLVSFLDVNAQKRSLTFNGSFSETPFPEFAKAVEDQTGTSFYYRASWVQNLRVSIRGEDLSLFAVLDSILGSVGVHYYVDDWNHIILTDGESLIEKLPEYRGVQSAIQEAVPGDGESKEVTNAELNYIDGRKTRVLEVMQVGRAEQAVPGRKALVSGQVCDAENGEPLMGVTVYIESLNMGASTGSDGRFSLMLDPGSYGVEFQSMGMETLQFTMQVRSDGELDLDMRRTLIPLDEVVITAGRQDNVRGNQMGYERLNYSVLKQVPQVMGERDILNVVKLLPGVQSVGEGTAGFNVRGSAADQNMIYINKIPVYNSSHLFGFFTAISPEIVKDFSLYKSNLPASFGGRLASFFDIQSRQGNMKHLSARAGISLVSAYAALEGPLKKDKSSVALSVRSTYSDWILSLMEDPQLRDSEAGFNDLSGVYTLKASERTSMKVFGYLSRDRFKLADDQEYAYGNYGAALDIRHHFNPRSNGSLALIYSRYQFDNRDTQIRTAGFEQSSYINHYELKADVEWLPLERHRFNYGISTIYYHLDRGTIKPYGSVSIREALDLGLENGVEAALYLSDEITLGERLKAYAGLRISSFYALGPCNVRTYLPGTPPLEENIGDTIFFGKGELSKTYFGLEPRLNLRYLLNDQSSLKVSFNRGYQYLFVLSNTVAMAPTDQWKLVDYHITPQFLDQLSAGYYLSFTGTGISSSIEIYRKWGHNIIDYRDGASFTENPYVESSTLQGEQAAYGIETMIRRDAGGLNGWLSYTYSRSFMQVDLDLPGEQINGGKPYPSNFDRPHNLSLVLNYQRGRRISLSGNLVYMTGRPSTFPVSVYYEYEVPYVYYSARNKYRIPDYFRIDLSMNIEGSLKKNKRFHSFWMVGIYNLTGRNNAYSVYFQNENGLIRGYKLSIFAQPVLMVSWNVRLGNYVSE